MSSLSPVFFSIFNLVHNVCIEYIYVCIFVCSCCTWCPSWINKIFESLAVESMAVMSEIITISSVLKNTHTHTNDLPYSNVNKYNGINCLYEITKDDITNIQSYVVFFKLAEKNDTLKIV